MAAMSSVGAIDGPGRPVDHDRDPDPLVREREVRTLAVGTVGRLRGTADPAVQRHEPHRPLEADLVVVGVAHPLQQLQSRCRRTCR